MSGIVCLSLDRASRISLGLRPQSVFSLSLILSRSLGSGFPAFALAAGQPGRGTRREERSSGRETDEEDRRENAGRVGKRERVAGQEREMATGFETVGGRQRDEGARQSREQRERTKAAPRGGTRWGLSGRKPSAVNI